jgi:hypothetical protein
VGDCIRQLPGIELGNAECSYVIGFLEVSNGLGGVALRQQGIAQQLVSGRQIGIEFQSLLQRRNRSPIVTFFQIGLAQSSKSHGRSWFQLGHFLEFSNRRVEVATLLGLSAGLHVLRHFGR